MSDHALAESLMGLASRVETLSRTVAGDERKRLRDQSDDLAKLAMAARAQSMDATNARYQEAVQGVGAAITAIGAASPCRTLASL